MRLKLGVAAGAVLCALGATLWVMALVTPGWARDVRLCTVALGGALLAAAGIWFALLWYGVGRLAGEVADRIAPVDEAELEAETATEVEAAGDVEIEQPVRRRYDLTWEW